MQTSKNLVAFITQFFFLIRISNTYCITSRPLLLTEQREKWFFFKTSNTLLSSSIIRRAKPSSTHHSNSFVKITEASLVEPPLALIKRSLYIKIEFSQLEEEDGERGGEPPIPRRHLKCHQRHNMPSEITG